MFPSTTTTTTTPPFFYNSSAKDRYPSSPIPPFLSTPAKSNAMSMDKISQEATASYLVWRATRLEEEARARLQGKNPAVKMWGVHLANATGPASRKDIPLPDTFLCRICMHVKGKNLFSKKEYVAYQAKAFLNPGRKHLDQHCAIICRNCAGQPLVELACQGPCARVVGLDDFAKNQRSEQEPWCLLCLDWKLATEPVSVPLATPIPGQSMEETMSPLDALKSVALAPEREPVKEKSLIDLSSDREVITQRGGWSVLTTSTSVSGSSQGTSGRIPAGRSRGTATPTYKGSPCGVRGPYIPAGKYNFAKIPRPPPRPRSNMPPPPMPHYEHLQTSDHEGEDKD